MISGASRVMSLTAVYTGAPARLREAPLAAILVQPDKEKSLRPRVVPTPPAMPKTMASSGENSTGGSW